MPPRIWVGRIRVGYEWVDLEYVGDGDRLGVRVGWRTGFTAVMSAALR